jgi:hypothetical protein
MPIYITPWNLTTAVSNLAGAWHDAQSQEKRYPGTDRHVAQGGGACFCSNVYDVNTWMWQFGRGKPRLGGLTIEETLDRQDLACKASDKRWKETSDGSKDDGA